MLFFINTLRKNAATDSYLNTSHVILYHEGKRYAEAWIFDLNTSHVILYQAYSNTSAPYQENLNTSHVILYLARIAQLLQVLHI